MGRTADIAVKKFGANGPTPSVSPQLAGTGTITVVAAGVRATGTIACTTKAVQATGLLTATTKANLVEAETFTLDDGTNAASVFEFDGVAGAADGVVGANVVVDVSGVSTAVDIAGVITTAINNVGAGLAITAVDNLDGTVTLTNDAFHASGNTTSAETVDNAAFILTDMTGGVTGILDTETVTIDDGANPATVFEFSTDGAAGGGNALVNISTDSSAIEVAARLTTAINAVGAGLTVVATAVGDGTVTLVNSTFGVAGNVAITETVTAAAFTVAGMTGGAAGLIDGDYFTLDDGVNPAVIFEFDIPSGGVTGGRTAVTVAEGAATTVVRDAIISAIAGVGAGLAITASSGGAATVNLVMDDETPGASTTENVADAGFLVTGLSEPNPAQTWGFKLVGIRSTDSTVTAAGTEGTTAEGPATADADNQIDITWTDASNWVAAGIDQVQIWLTTAPGAVVEGLVGTVDIGDEAFTYTGQVQTSALANIPTTNTTGDGDATNVLHFREKTVMLHSVGVGTYQLQGSLDNATWVNEGSALTATSTAAIEVSETYAYLRWKCTAYTSGTPTSMLAGHYEG